MQLKPHFDLACSRHYQQNQLPHLVVITSQADSSTRVLFPLGRSALEQYADMYTTTVGHYIPLVTHQLGVTRDCKAYHEDRRALPGPIN